MSIKGEKLTFGVVLPTCNRANLVRGFLETIDKQRSCPHELILVDQSDDESTKKVFEDWKPANIQKKYLHRNVKSLVLARNAGIKASGNTDLIAFFDDDILLDFRFCEEIVKVFESDEGGQYAGGMGTVEPWKYKPKPLQAFFLMSFEGSGKFLASGAPTFPHWKKEFTETEFVSGGCTFWRRHIIQEYLFDERLRDHGYGDDVDISYRVSRRYKLFLQPRAVCYQQKDPPGRILGRQYRRAWIQNMYYLAQKNDISLLAYSWCVLGHFFRDLICLDFQKLLGDFEGTFNIVCGRIDTVAGYKHFIKQLRQERQ